MKKCECTGKKQYKEGLLLSVASGIHKGSWVPAGYRVSHTDLPLFCDYILKGLPLLASRDASELLVWGYEAQVHRHLRTNTANSIRRGQGVAPEWPGLRVACLDNWTSGNQDAEREAEAAVTASNSSPTALLPAQPHVELSPK